MMQIKNYMNLQPQQRLYEILPLVFQQAKGRPLAPASSVVKGAVLYQYPKVLS